MEITLLGTGDTTGTPTIGCDCDTCETARERGVERSRFSVHVRNERTDESLLVDMSPDFRHQFLTHGTPLPDAAIVTHVHFDHLHGLGNVYRLMRDLDVYAADEVDPITEESVADTIRSTYYYLDRIDVHDVSPYEPTRICGLDVTFVPVDHPPLVCYGLAIEDPETGVKFSISGDTTYDVPAESRDVLRDPDLLLADALVPHHFGGEDDWNDRDERGVPRTFRTKHMTREGGLALAEDLDAERVRLVHMAHFYPAEEAFEEPLAVDGERYTL